MPLTAGYLTVLVGGSLWLEQLDRDSRLDLLRTASTNVSNLGGGEWHVLLTSALVVVPPAVRSLLIGAPVLAAGELLFGAHRATAVFLTGHVLASLAVAGLLQERLLPGVSTEDARTAVDVGLSYGVLAVAAAIAVTRRRVPYVWVGLLVALVGASLLRESATFTEWGHLFSVLLGIGAGLRLRTRVSAAAQWQQANVTA